MPFIDRKIEGVGAPAVAEFDTPDPAFLDTLGAAYRQENIIGSALAKVGNNLDAMGATGRNMNAIDPSYNVFDDPDMKAYLDEDPEIGVDIFNKAAADARRAQIDMERKDRATLDASGWTGFGLSMVAGMSDPTILVPGGALARSGRIGYSAARSAAAVGVAAGVGAAAQEAGLQATQEERSAGQTAIAIGGSVILGGLVGGAAGSLFSKGEWDRVSRQLEADLADDVPNPGEVTQTIVGRLQSAGAAAVEQVDLSDLGIGGGRAAELVARATAAARINPGVQTMLSPSVKVREIYGKLVDNPIYTTMNMEGRSLGPAVENLVKLYDRGALADWIKTNNDLYLQYRKSLGQGAVGARLPARGTVMSRAQFNEAVSRAGRRGDIDPAGNEFVTRAAQEARAKVFDPLLERAKAAGLLPEDVKVSTSASYVTRMWNVQRLIGEEDRFRAIARKWFTGLAKSEAKRLQMVKDTRIGRIQSVLADLELEGPERTRLLSELPAQLKALREANARFDPVDEDLRSLRSQQFDARQKGDKATVTKTSAEIDAITQKAGKDYADYVSQRNALQSRLARIRGNVVGRAEQVDQIRARIADVEGQNVERLHRLHRSLANLDNRAAKASPELLAEEIAKVRTKFAQVMERSEKAMERLAARKAGDGTPVDDAARAAFDAAEMRRIEEANILAAKISDLEKIDPEEALNELRDLVQYRLEKAAEIVEREGARIAELSAKLEKANPARVTERIKALNKKIQDIEVEFNGSLAIRLDDEADFNDYVEEAVTSVFNNLTGRNRGEMPEWMVPVTRGPLKERTFNIPDELVEDFLENDMEAILRRYARTMAAEVELTDKFGRADMRDQIAEINREYDELSAAAKTPEERIKLDARRRQDLTNLEAFRDMIRGTYRASDEASNWSKITRAALTWNYIRLLGGVALSSFTDASRIVGVHGVRATMKEALPGLIKGVNAAKISRADAKALGAVTERVLQSRLASLAELNNPYARGSRFERFLSNTSSAFTKATGLGYWNDMMKSIASVMTQNRMMRNILASSEDQTVDAVVRAGSTDTVSVRFTKANYEKIDKAERAYMAMLGIDETMAQRIAGQFKRYGIEEDGIYGANVSMWDDELAKRAWAAALNKDVDRTIITKSVADTPLWMKTNWGKLIMQFKSFGLASHQRVLIAGLQERPHRLAEQMVFATSIGMMVAYLKFMERGDVDKAENLLNNPGKWVADGLDRSGILSIPFEISNTIDKISEGVGGPNVGISRAASLLAGDKDASGSVSRYASRGAVGAVAGPSLGIFEDLATIAAQLSQGDLKRSAVNAMIRQVPGATLPGFRTGIHVGIKPVLTDAVD